MSLTDFVNQVTFQLRTNYQEHLEIYRKTARRIGPCALVYERAFDRNGRPTPYVYFAPPSELEAMWTDGSKEYSQRVAEYNPFTTPDHCYILIGISAYDSFGRNHVHSRLFHMRKGDLQDTRLETKRFRTKDRATETTEQ